MATGGFYERKKISPTGLTLVVTLHAVALTALALSKMDVPIFIRPPITHVDTYRVPPDPKPNPEREQPKSRPKTEIEYVKRLVEPMPLPRDPDLVLPPIAPPFFGSQPSGSGTKPVDTPKIVPPVRVEAQMSRSSELQPPYPASEQRSETEGRVAIRVRIGTDGRVIAVERVSATNDAFYRATERHALRAWRFRPATLDGKPIESSKVINVTFRLDG
ncbi:MAG: TonB family protein [Sphingosinicella sp.]|nr:TonB family protein [Sphingosinicella sp.]